MWILDILNAISGLATYLIGPLGFMINVLAKPLDVLKAYDALLDAVVAFVTWFTGLFC